MTGSLADAEARFVNPASPLSLAADTTDGVRGGTAAQQRTEIDTVELSVSKDGGTFQSQGVQSDSACSGDSCPGPPATFTAGPAILSEGRHAVRVVARDRLYATAPSTLKARHATERILRFGFDQTPPESVSVAGSFAAQLKAGVTNVKGDIDVTFPGVDALSGMKHFELDEVDDSGTTVQTIAAADGHCQADGSATTAI